MKKLTLLFAFLIFSVSLPVNAQERPQPKKIVVTGKVIDKTTKEPLEYTTIGLQNTRRQEIFAGGITDAKGEFSIELMSGEYDIKIEFISFKPLEIKAQKITDNLNLGTIILEEDATMLSEIEIRQEVSTLSIKLDKKVYNVGQDMMVKGGTVSDVLDNVPSVSVDADGTVSLRGNDNVRILIDGKPSNAINISEALRQIPADAIDKVEVVTNPSARYDSEGGGGLLNIILKKGKNQGINGTVIVSAGDPESYGVSGNVNFKSEEFNLFTNFGYNKRNNPGNSLTESKYLNPDGTTRNYIDEVRNNIRKSEGFNGSFGLDWFLDKNTTWTNIFSFRKNDNNNPETILYSSFDTNHNFTGNTYRYNDQIGDSENIEYSTNLTKNFSKEGHTLTFDAAFSQNKDNGTSIIGGDFDETTANVQKQNRNVLQLDYVLPIGEKSQFELGYKGDFNKLLTDYKVGKIEDDGSYSSYDQFSNALEYKEKINALYTQFGTKFGKFSALFGLRWEDSDIDINLLTTDNFHNKKYNNFFPSAFFTYEISDNSSTSLSYSRRVSRPRGRMINPFSNYSSNINIFQGNPDLDASFTNAFDLGFLKRWSKLTLSTSMYLNQTTESVQFVRKESGEFVDVIIDGEEISTPVILTSPINLATQYRFGFEFTLNYNPFKWWRLNSNFNFYRNETQGDYSYVNFHDELITQNFDNTAYSWFTRLTSKITLPYKIDWQTNLSYNGPQNTAQGKSLGVFAANLGFSKDVLKEKGTIALNVQDVFNSRKRISETSLPLVESYSEMQWRERQITLTFTYRFNKKKEERDRQPRRDNNGGDEGEFMGG